MKKLMGIALSLMSLILADCGQSVSQDPKVTRLLNSSVDEICAMDSNEIGSAMSKHDQFCESWATWKELKKSIGSDYWYKTDDGEDSREYYCTTFVKGDQVAYRRVEEVGMNYDRVWTERKGDSSYPLDSRHCGQPLSIDEHYAYCARDVLIDPKNSEKDEIDFYVLKRSRHNGIIADCNYKASSHCIKDKGCDAYEGPLATKYYGEYMGFNTVQIYQLGW